MNILEIKEALQKHNIHLNDIEIAQLWGMDKGYFSRKKKQGTQVKQVLVELLEQKYNIKLTGITNVDYTQENNKIIANITQDNNNNTCPYRLENNCPCREQFNIPYYENLPEDLKKNDFTSCHIDREIIENYWKYNKDDLRIIPIFTNHLTYYPDERMPFGHICVMDIASTDINKAGVYCFTTNSGIFIRKLNLLLDGSVQFMDYSEPTPKVSKTITPEQLENVNFTVIGRVFKCISTRI